MIMNDAAHPQTATSPPSTVTPPVNHRSIRWVVAGIVAAVTLVALIAQMALLGALGTNSSGTASKLTLTPAVNAQLMGQSASAPIKFDASRGAAVAQVRGLNVASRDVLALNLATENVTGNAQLMLGWLTTQNINRPVSSSAILGAGAEPKTSIVLLSGHPRWRETVLQIALGFENTGGGGPAPGAVLTNIELVPATPTGALSLLYMAWFKADGNVVTPKQAANRLLPLALWLALICTASVAVAALIYRRDPAERATALKLTAIALTVLAVSATLLSSRWAGWSVPIGAGVAAVIALLLIDPPRRLPLSVAGRSSIVLLVAGVCTFLSPLVAAVALMPAVMLLIASIPSPRAAPLVSAGAMLATVPVLLVAAVSQGLIVAPALLSPLTDPTRALAGVAMGAGGLPGLALGMLAMHQLWPAPAQSRRWSTGAAVAAVWAVAGALLVLSVPKIAVTASGGSTYLALFFPALTCLGLALLPKFRGIAQSLADTQVREAKTERDLSVQALSLLESHGDRVQTTVARRELGAAHAAVKQMQRIAPAAHITHLAELRLALADGDLATANAAANALGLVSPSELTPADHDALLELAHRQHQQQRVIELAPGAAVTEGNRRALAMALLATDGPVAAISALADWPVEHVFARELAELYLLIDDVAATQRALVNTGILLTDPIGQAYFARLGMRVQGPQMYAQGINSLTTWHPQVGAAHAAQGELMLRQGSLPGARARFILAIKVDAALWPLQKHLQALDAAAASAKLAR